MRRPACAAILAWCVSITSACSASPPATSYGTVVADAQSGDSGPNLGDADGDLAQTDASNAEVQPDASDAAVADTDAQGNDTAQPSDADAGPNEPGKLATCSQVYLAQQGTCGTAAPSAACIDGAAGAGSPSANALFAPLAECEKTFCVANCKSTADADCLEKCVAKNCASQFLACGAENASGADNCATAFTCAYPYKDKLLSVASFCYAKATPKAQQQVAAIFGCMATPKLLGCSGVTAACFAEPNPTAGCAKSLECAQTTCGSDNAACWACMGAASPVAVPKLQALEDCLLQCWNSCGQADCDCFNGTCKPQATDCSLN